MRRILTAIAACAVSAVLVVPTSAAQAGPAASVTAVPSASFATPAAGSCARTLKNIQLFQSTSGFSYPSGLTILNGSTTVDLNTFGIGDQKYSDPSQVLWYRSLLWLALAAVSDHEAGNDARASTQAQALIRAATAFPDPGSATPELLAISNTVGWDEGTAMRRAQALLCLATFTGAAAVDPLLRVHANALMDATRYMGPPNRPVHNHGLMANVTLLEIGELLGEGAYRQVALDRLRNDYKTAFDELGMNWEGSSHYHTVNIDFWADAVNELTDRGFTGDAQALSATLDKARGVAAQFISPTGVPLLVGNSRPNDGYLNPGRDASRPLQFVDKEVGMAMGRWSWTNSKTSWWTAFNRARRGAHGHYDQTSVTWQANGVPILTDVGQPDYDTIGNPLTIWSKSAPAQNESVPTALAGDGKQIATLDASRVGDLDTILMTSTQNGPLQTREVIVDNKRKTMQVSDHVRGGQTQHWHFSPEWNVQSIAGATARLVGPGGLVVTVQTSPGSTISQLKGSLSPLGGWQVTGFKEQVPATELLVTTSRRAVVTTFALTAPTAKANDLTGPKVTSLEAGRRRATVDWSGLAAGGKASGTATTTGSPSAAPVTPKAVSPEAGSAAASPTPTDVSGDVSARALTKKPPVSATKITGYRVIARQGGGPWFTAAADTQSIAMRRVFKQLKNGERYRFRVAALGKRVIGPFGPQSKAVTPRTMPDAITLPVIATAKPVKKGGVRLSWTEPTWNGGAAISGYQIRIPGEGWQDRKPRFAEFLMEKRNLVVKVRAVNVAGPGKILRIVLQRQGGTPVVISPAPPPVPTPTPAPTPVPPPVQ